MKYLIILFMAFSLIACKKDQKAINKLKGTWTATKWNVSEPGLTIDLIALGGAAEVTFGGCDLDANTWCDYSASTSFLGISEDITSEYRVSNNGQTLEIKDSLGASNSSTILELSDSFLKLQEINGEQTITVEATK